MNTEKLKDSEMLDAGCMLLAKETRDHVNAYRYFNIPIEPEILQLILNLKLWRRWGYDHLFLALRKEAGLSAEQAKRLTHLAEENNLCPKW